MDVVRGIEGEDEIDVIISQCPLRSDQEVRERYNIPGRASPDKWVTVSFIGQDLSKVQSAEDELANKGISFDTGRSADLIEWELDWSFCIL